jgi:FdhD protein
MLKEASEVHQTAQRCSLPDNSPGPAARPLISASAKFSKPGLRTPPRSLELTQVTEWNSGQTQRVQDSLAAEEPLEIRLNGAPLTVTMRTPGHDLELAAGFLVTEGIVDQLDHIGALRSPASRKNIVEVDLDEGAFDLDHLRRNFFAASSCGICGKATIESIRRRGLRPPDRTFRIDPEVLCTMPHIVRAQQAVFARTGGLHAAALFDESSRILALREDVGRHNAVDKLIGWALLNNYIPLDRTVMLVSGRGGFEIVQKALAAAVPILASVSAPSSLAVKLAREMGMTLIGFLRGQRFVIYSGEFRIDMSRDPQQAVS